MTEIKAITVHNPWATAIIFGGKNIENRSWPTDYRGTLLIHAGQKYDSEGADWMIGQGLEIPRLAEARGIIVGTVTLADCVRNSRSRWAEDGFWHWVLADPRPVDRIVPMRGRQGLYAPDDNWTNAFTV